MKPLQILFFLLISFLGNAYSQQDSSRRDIRQSDSLQVLKDSVAITHPVIHEDTMLRITNLSPYITLHVDSTLNYKLDINKDPNEYYWFLKNAPVGLKINKDNGLLTFKAEKSYFMSGRLKYDTEYKVSVGVQKLKDAKEKVDTSFTLVFYNTEIIPSRIKLTVSNVLNVEEGDTINFRIQCEPGSFPIESIIMTSSVPIKEYTAPSGCNGAFGWAIPFDFVKETDSAKQKAVMLSFIGINKFLVRDTASVKIYVKDALNFPQREKEYLQTVKDVKSYILQLKFAFRELDRTVKKTKKGRTTFDLASGTSALGGTVFSTMKDDNSRRTSVILPSVGVALVPVKEAISPVKTAEQNSAAAIRTNIRRLEYMLTETSLIGDRDPDIASKIKRLKDELKQSQLQLIDIPVDTGNLSESELNSYFNNPKINKKYRLTNK